MNRLLDVSTLIALLFKRHVHHKDANKWLEGVRPVLCPISELGWLRVATHPSINLTMEDALRTLRDFAKGAEFISCDLSALDADESPSSAKTTDWYLASLAKRHGMKWATFDTKSNHPNAELIPVSG